MNRSSILFGLATLLATGCSGVVVEVMKPLPASSFDSEACVEGALRGNPDPTDLPAAVDHFRTRCALHEASACSALGLLHERGLAVDKDPRRAAALYRTACEAGYEAGCVNLGRLHREGRGVERRSDKATALFAAACRSDHAPGCTELARQHAGATGAIRDLRQAERLYRRACDAGDHPACYELGKLYEEGRLRPDTMSALVLYEKACAGGEMDACDGVGRVLAEARPLDASPPPKGGTRLGAASQPHPGDVP